MPILTAKQTWKRAPNPRGHKSRAELNRLLPIEDERVRVAMRVLYVRYGNWTRVSEALGHHRVTVERVLNIRSTATPAFGMRVARLLGVSLGGRAEWVLAEAGGVPDVWRRPSTPDDTFRCQRVGSKATEAGEGANGWPR